MVPPPRHAYFQNGNNHGGEGVNSMEIKAERDIRNTVLQRFQIKEAFERWVAFHRQSSDKEPTAFEAFRAGWIETTTSAKGGV